MHHSCNYACMCVAVCCSLWPVLGSGFSDMVRRSEVQAQANAENQQRFDQIKELDHKLRIRLVRGQRVGGRV